MQENTVHETEKFEISVWEDTASYILSFIGYVNCYCHVPIC